MLYLHNAVELFMKQMMINDADHNVAFVRKPKNEHDEKLKSNYMKATDLNYFFAHLTPEQREKFGSINFGPLINKYGKDSKESLELLQRLRNNETHFFIDENTFLTETEFVQLHNFMIDFDKILHHHKILTFIGHPPGKNGQLYFGHKPIKSFSYIDALEKSKSANEIITKLNNSYYHDWRDSAFEIAERFDWGSDIEISSRFDDIYAIIEMLIKYKKIIFVPETGSCSENGDEELEYYTIKIN